MPRGNYEVVVDRKKAIYRAVAMAQARDIILIAGKGHETYQEFADNTVPFDDIVGGPRMRSMRNGWSCTTDMDRHPTRNHRDLDRRHFARRRSPTCARRCVCTDSRSLQGGDLFVALRGDKFDGHTFVVEAAKRGAIGGGRRGDAGGAAR